MRLTMLMTAPFPVRNAHSTAALPRLVFALWPDERVRREIAALRSRMAQEYCGHETRADTLHLTLLFVGNIPDLRVPTLLACGDRVQARSRFISRSMPAAISMKPRWRGWARPNRRQRWPIFSWSFSAKLHKTASAAATTPSCLMSPWRATASCFLRHARFRPSNGTCRTSC